MFLKINKVLLTILIFFFFTKCENELVNLNSNDISTILELVKFDLDSENSQSYHFDSLDSLVSTSPRLYAFSSPESQIILDLNVSKIHNDDSCLSDSISLVKLELSSLNQLVEKSIDEENEDSEDSEDSEDNEIISDIYIDTNGIEILGNNIPLNFEIDEYDIIIDSLHNQIVDFCLLENLEFIITYENNLIDDDIRDYVEIFSSNYTFEPSQPKLHINYNVLEEETVTNDKYNIDSIETDEEFDVYVVNNSESDDNGAVFLVNYDNESAISNLDSVIFINEIEITDPIISSVPSEFNIKLDFSIEQEDIGLDSFFPIQIYLDNVIGYPDNSDPQGDNWNDCGTDGVCSESDPD